MDQGAAKRLHVVAMPYPGRGHINPMLILCRLLSARGVRITFVVTEEWLGLLSSSSLPPTGLTFRTIPNVIPSEHGRAADFIGFLEAVYRKMGAPFERLLDELVPAGVSAVVADTYLPWAVAAGERRGVPVCSLCTMSAALFSALFHFDRVFAPSGDGRPASPTEVSERLIQYIPGLKHADLSSILAMENSLKLALEAFSWARKAKCLLFTSFYELEAFVIDQLRAELRYPVYTIGPSIPFMMLEKPRRPIGNNGSIDLFTWLDSQPQNSVLYVSLGSFLSVSAAQVEEIAMGLRNSGVRFLWIARGDSSRMQEIIGDKGLVVQWCDQLKVLCHSSVGGFLTHCGWNSTLEGVFAGLPLLTLPIFWDQLVDSRLIVHVWKIGLSLREEARSENFIKREDIAKSVKKLMDFDGVEGGDFRRRAMELSRASQAATQGGGSSFINLDSFLNDLRQGFHC